MNIRIANEADLTDLVSMVSLSLTNEYLNYDSDDLSNDVSIWVNGSDHIVIIATTPQDKIIGFCLLCKSGTSIDGDGWLNVQPIFVITEHQSRGVGQLLLSEAKEYGNLTAFIHPENIQSVKLFSKSGFAKGIECIDGDNIRSDEFVYPDSGLTLPRQWD